VKAKDDSMLELMQYAFTRLDGAWFMGVARKQGIEAAWEADIEAWTQFAPLLGKRIRKHFIPAPVWPQSFIEALEIMARLMKIGGRELSMEGDRLTIRVTDCEVQRMIAKAGVADCGIATRQTYRGIAQGLFAGRIDLNVEHLKNLNHGDDCCLIRLSPM